MLSGKPEHHRIFIAFSTSDSARDLAVLPVHFGFGCMPEERAAAPANAAMPCYFGSMPEGRPAICPHSQIIFRRIGQGPVKSMANMGTFFTSPY
jgi:hypothetical protein